MGQVAAFLYLFLFAFLLWASGSAARELNLKRHSAFLFQMLVVPIVYVSLYVSGYFINELLSILFS